MTWDEDPEPDIPDHRYSVRVQVEVELEVTAPKGADDTTLAHLAEELLESDLYVNCATVQGTPEVLDEEDA